MCMYVKCAVFVYIRVWPRLETNTKRNGASAIYVHSLANINFFVNISPHEVHSKPHDSLNTSSHNRQTDTPQGHLRQTPTTKHGAPPMLALALRLSSEAHASTGHTEEATDSRLADAVHQRWRFRLQKGVPVDRLGAESGGAGNMETL